MPTKDPKIQRLIDEYNKLSKEIKRLRLHLFSMHECKNGWKGDWCEHCPMLDADDEVCIVDREKAPIYADEEGQ